MQTRKGVGEAVSGNMGHQRYQHKVKLNPLDEMLTRLSEKDLENWWTCGRQKNAKRGWKMGGNLSNLTWQKKNVLQQLPLDKDSKERGLSPLENKESEACLFKKYIYLLVASHCSCWIRVRHGAELQFRCTNVHTHHGHWAKEQQGKGRAIHSSDCGYLHGHHQGFRRQVIRCLKKPYF